MANWPVARLLALVLPIAPAIAGCFAQQYTLDRSVLARPMERLPRQRAGAGALAEPVKAAFVPAPVAAGTPSSYLADRSDGDAAGDVGTRDAARSDRGVILDDGPMRRLNHAQLDRFGFASRLEVGSASLSALRGAADYGPQARLAFGGFPLHRVGILVGAQLAAGPVDEANGAGGSAFNGRLFGEIDWLPLRLGQFYGGVFVELGSGIAREDVRGATIGKSAMTTAGGAFCEVALNSRLALSIRADAASVPSLTAASSVWIPEFAVGLSVY